MKTSLQLRREQNIPIMHHLSSLYKQMYYLNPDKEEKT